YANAYTPAVDVLSDPLADRMSETGFGINKATLNDLQTGINSYNSGSYTIAREQLLQFKAVAAEDGLAPYATFYAALSALESGDFNTAQLELLTLENTENFELQNDAIWYAGLAALKQGKTEVAMESLRKLRDDTEFGERVRKVLNALE
ncbi:MAG: tol-pal system YbgF family protein, partial [Saprospiraceae bacterium]